MKKLVLALVIMCVAFPAFGQKIDRVALAAKLQANAREALQLKASPAEEISTSKSSEPFRLLGAEIGVSWAGDHWEGYVFGRYLGGRAKVFLDIDGNKQTQIEAERSTLLRQTDAWGIVLGYMNGERKYIETFDLFTIGTHTITTNIAGRMAQAVQFEITPLIFADVCTNSGPGDPTSVVVALFAFYFNKPPHTEAAEVFVDGALLSFDRTALERDLLRVDTVMSVDEYRTRFNGSDVWKTHTVVIETDSRVGPLSRTPSFPPISSTLPPC